MLGSNQSLKEREKVTHKEKRLKYAKSKKNIGYTLCFPKGLLFTSLNFPDPYFNISNYTSMKH